MAMPRQLDSGSMCAGGAITNTCGSTAVGRTGVMIFLMVSTMSTISE